MDPQQNDAEPPLAVGERVAILAGPFMQQEGDVVDVELPTGQVKVELLFWGRPVWVIVEQGSIRRVDR